MLGRPKIWAPVLIMICPGSVVERVGDHPLDDGDVVDHLGQVRQELGEFRTALAVPGEPEFRAQQLGAGLDERGAIALDQVGRRQASRRTWRAGAGYRRVPGDWVRRP